MIDFNDLGYSTNKRTECWRVEHAKYCDEALLKIKSSAKRSTLWIVSDLSFKADHNKNHQLNSGEKDSGSQSSIPR
jgi:hypothetical protein